jgi:hypothetical protein
MNPSATDPPATVPDPDLEEKQTKRDISREAIAAHEWVKYGLVGDGHATVPSMPAVQVPDENQDEDPK